MQLNLSAKVVRESGSEVNGDKASQGLNLSM
jgi:hypothetical protein